MNRNDARVLSTTSAAASLLLAAAAVAQPSLTWVGTPLQVVDASADGTALVGTGGTQTFTGTDPAYYWSATGGLVQLPINGAGGTVNRAGVSAMSDDGQAIIGWLYNAPTYNMYYPVTWNASAPGAFGTYLTPANATGRGVGSDISADGTRHAFASAALQHGHLVTLRPTRLRRIYQRHQRQHSRLCLVGHNRVRRHRCASRVCVVHCG